MIALDILLEGFADKVPALEISGVELDSRCVTAGCLFVALNGLTMRGHDYIADVLAAGVAAVVYDAAIKVDIESDIPIFAIDDLSNKAGVIAGRFYGWPADDMFVAGVTGTNGKTSCTQFIAQALHQSTEPAAVIGTLGNGVWNELDCASHTTPDAVSVQRLLRQLKAKAVGCVAMEVSSHALDQGRVVGVDFDVAVLTNLSHDHLDYHGTMAAYGEAKARLFLASHPGAAVVNVDDSFGRALIAKLPVDMPVIAYGLQESPVLPAHIQYVHGQIQRCDHQGLVLAVKTKDGCARIDSTLLGQFNASNLLAVLGVLLVKGLSLDDACARLSQLETVAGRMERFGGDGRVPLVVVDYAHTPDALEQVLIGLRDHCQGLLWCVFGCGGDRDREKRPLMGRIAERFADRIVVTDDNPRHELSDNIIQAILDGMQQQNRVVAMADRRLALRHAIESAGANDVILVAGKGHEKYQQVGDQRISFSDRNTVAELLQEVA